MMFLRGKGRADSGRGLARALACVLILAGQARAQRAFEREPQRSSGAAPGGLARAFEGRPPAFELRRRLGSLEADGIPLLFQLAVTGQLPPGAGGGDVLVLGEEERQVVRECLAARPRRELVPFLTDLAMGPLETSARLEAQRLLMSIGAGDHLRLLARATAPSQGRAALPYELRAGFTAAMSAILGRDPAALREVPLLFSDSPPGLAGPIVEALARQPGHAVTRVLASLLGRSPGLDPLLLARLGERGSRREPGDEVVFDSVRRYLRHGDPALVSAAARTCGWLGDDGSVETLIGLIEHADARVRDSVFQALGTISGHGFGADPARWTRWYNEEMRWWEEEADSLLVRVERGRGLEFARAAREVLEHRLFRDRIAESFAQALRRENTEEARLACRALEQLRSSSAVKGLVECLESGDPELREAAWKALRAITGAELPPEADSWARFAG